ncbi:MAG: hemolysin family protein [Roseitalea porphyridii]|uniref:hemolysin family protein n=1 Tax=Roseitalea porphyridii TaxID=1852022 RepID=UPI0032D9030B
MLTSLVIVIALIALNGLFALAELAVVSSNRARLDALAEKGRAGAHAAVALNANPGRFLSSVQIGITLVGIVNGAFSAETFGEAAAGALIAMGVAEATAATLGFGVIVLVVTYLSVVVGELVPKALALRNPEAIACLVAPVMTLFARLAAPAVWLLAASTRVVMRLIGQAGETREAVTDEEIRSLIAQAEETGTVEAEERQMIAGVMRLADRRAASLMTPRPDIEWIDTTASAEEMEERVRTTGHTFLPVAEGSLDAVLGVIRTRTALTALLGGERLVPGALAKRVDAVLENAPALTVLERLRRAETPVVFVHDKNAHFEGLITPADILETIAGEFLSDAGTMQPDAIERADGSWLVEGAMPVDEAAELFRLTLPERPAYQTLAGFMLDRLRHLPVEGEALETDGWRFEVLDMDGQRIDKIGVSRALRIHRAGAGR